MAGARRRRHGRGAARCCPAPASRPARVVEDSIIGPGAVVRGGARVVNGSVIGDGVVVDDGEVVDGRRIPEPA